MKYIKVLTDLYKAIETLSESERGRLFSSMLKYAESGAEPEFPGNERIMWPTIKDEIDRQRKAYTHRCEVNKVNITNRYESLQIVTNCYESQRIAANCIKPQQAALEQEATEQEAHSINNNIYNTNLTYNPDPSCNQGLKDKDFLPEREKPTKEKVPLKAKAEPYFLTLAECQRTVHDYTESKAVREAAMGWVRMRYAKKGDHRLSPKALENALNKVRRLAKSEDAAVAVFAQSEERCWDGLFEVKP